MVEAVSLSARADLTPQPSPYRKQSTAPAGRECLARVPSALCKRKPRAQPAGALCSRDPRPQTANAAGAAPPASIKCHAQTARPSARRNPQPQPHPVPTGAAIRCRATSMRGRRKPSRQPTSANRVTAGPDRVDLESGHPRAQASTPQARPQSVRVCSFFTVVGAASVHTATNYEGRTRAQSVPLRAVCAWRCPLLAQVARTRAQRLAHINECAPGLRRAQFVEGRMAPAELAAEALAFPRHRYALRPSLRAQPGARPASTGVRHEKKETCGNKCGQRAGAPSAVSLRRGASSLLGFCAACTAAAPAPLRARGSLLYSRARQSVSPLVTDVCCTSETARARTQTQNANPAQARGGAPPLTCGECSRHSWRRLQRGQPLSAHFGVRGPNVRACARQRHLRVHFAARARARNPPACSATAIRGRIRMALPVGAAAALALATRPATAAPAATHTAPPGVRVHILGARATESRTQSLNTSGHAVCRGMPGGRPYKHAAEKKQTRSPPS